MNKKTGTIIVFLAVLILLIAPVNAADVTYEIRSTVYDNSNPSIAAGDFYWDANTFPAFWYQIGGGRSSEVLYIHNTWNSSARLQLGDTIPEGDLYYVSKPAIRRSKIGGSDPAGTFMVNGVDLERYHLMGLFGAQHVVMPADPASPSAGCKPDEIARILIDSDDKKTMTTGEEWKFSGGWSLVVQQVDVKGNKVWLELKKDGETVDSEVLSTDASLTKQERTYLYKDSDDNPVFYCYAASAFRGATTDLVVFEYVFLRGDIIEINTDDAYGAFKVQGFTVPAVLDNVTYAGNRVMNTGDDALVMVNSNIISLKAKQDINLHGGISIKTEDTTAPDLKLTLRKKVTIKVDDCPECPECPPENTGSENDEASNPSVAETQAAPETTGAASAVKQSEADTQSAADSASAPGFEILLTLLGIIVAARMKR
jgi:S-layer protein (TIGR01567 family)